MGRISCASGKSGIHMDQSLGSLLMLGVANQLNNALLSLYLILKRRREFLDLKLLVDWAVDSGFHLVQLLPINDTSVHGMWWDSYPYR